MSQHDDTGGEREPGLLSSIGRMFSGLFGGRKDQDEGFPDSPIFRMIGSEHEDDDPQQEVLPRVDRDDETEPLAPLQAIDPSVERLDDSPRSEVFAETEFGSSHDSSEPTRAPAIAADPLQAQTIGQEAASPGGAQDDMARTLDEIRQILDEKLDETNNTLAAILLLSSDGIRLG